MPLLNVSKAELHVHLEGAIENHLALALAEKNGVNLPTDRFQGAAYAWTDFLDFLNAFDAVGLCLQSGEDYRAITYAYLRDRALAGAVYVELMISPDHADQQGITYEDMLAGLIAACEEAEADHGIVGRIIVTCVRHLGVTRAQWVADQMRANHHPFVVGFGMGGDENAFTFADFRPAYDVAKKMGLGLTVHASEVRGAESLREALHALPDITRVGHGVRVIEDRQLLTECIRRGLHFEVCLGSNIALNVAPSYDVHPLHVLIQEGARFSLNSDDPPFFNTSLEAEYQTGQTSFGLTVDDLQAVTIMALEDSFSAAGHAIAEHLKSDRLV